jgi:hypothetical protein
VNQRLEEHVRATGWLVFILSYAASPIRMTRWLRGGKW